MGQALYRKHRPKKLSEVIGQEHVTKTLEQALKQGRISHAYLFTGPRGVGKTSIARILAHEVNGLPYDDDSVHIDIIEIDAASNRRIDEIRELRDKVFIAPTSAKYKVYIIDEVHMLTREAFNALLKTLEEPPEHVVFILATTDAHKLPETIISRTQRFSFKPGKQESMKDFLADLAKKEKIKITPDALDLLAEHGDGSFRDSVSLLDQASSHGKSVDVADVRQLLGLPPKEALQELLRLLSSNGDPASIMRSVHDLYQQGYQAGMIAKQLGKMTREDMITGATSLNPDQTLGLMTKLLEVPSSFDPERLLEIVLLEAAAPRDPYRMAPAAPSPKAAVAASAPATASTKQAPAPQAAAPEAESAADEPVASAPKKTDKKERKAPAESKADENVEPVEIDSEAWNRILASLKQKHNTLYGVVRMAEPDFGSGGLTLKCAFAFHQKRLSEPANRQRLLDIIHDLTGQTVNITCIVDENVKPPVVPPESKPVGSVPPEEISTISNIFGGGELLES